MQKHLTFLFFIFLFVACGETENSEIKEQNEVKDSVQVQNDKSIQEDVETVTIGEQVWMTKNLNVDHYSNGDIIPNIQEDSLWQQNTKGAWCYYNNDSVLGEKYGKLYNWYAINDDRGICPTGWRVPNEEDWDELVAFLGVADSAGGPLKDTIMWEGKNAGATNETGFSALPGGYRLTDGEFMNRGIIATFWTASQGDGNNAWDRFLISKTPFVGRSQYGFENGFSCRCIKE